MQGNSHLLQSEVLFCQKCEAFREKRNLGSSDKVYISGIAAVEKAASNRVAAESGLILEGGGGSRFGLG